MATGKFWVNNHAHVVQGNDRASTLFLSYALAATDVSGYLSGSTMPKLTQGNLNRIPVIAPPVEEQKRIAKILGTLDDKIELNRRMNATLETMTRALFQSWFVDFDPVRRNAEGGESRPEDYLFPDSFEDAEMGEIPKGWRVMRVGDFVERLSVGQKYDQKTVFPVGTVPVLDQGKSGVIGFHNYEPGVKATLDRPVAVFANHTCYMRLISFPFSAIQNVLPFVGKDVDTLWARSVRHGPCLLEPRSECDETVTCTIPPLLVFFNRERRQGQHRRKETLQLETTG